MEENKGRKWLPRGKGGAYDVAILRIPPDQGQGLHGRRDGLGNGEESEPSPLVASRIS